MQSETALQQTISAELEMRRRARLGQGYVAPDNWQDWCKELFPKTFNKPFGKRHVEFWEWIEAIQPALKPKAFIGVWGRGGAKSTNAETGAIRVGATDRRKFALYVSSTQLKADAHVASISSKLEQPTFAKYYYKMSNRAVNQYGASKGWRREVLRCANGFTVQSFGLDTGMRGIKVDDYRPDLIILDDIDELHESVVVTLKKERIITDTILPSGSSDCAVLAIQNLIGPDSIFSRLVDGRADFLKIRQQSGPFPAIDNLAYEQTDEGTYEIISGTATWEGQDIETCQAQMNEWGLSAFLRESQHEVAKTGGRWDHITFMHKTWEEVKDVLLRVVVWVDPAVTSTDQSDCQGIICGGTIPAKNSIKDQHMVVLYSWEGIDSPHKSIKRAIYVGYEYGAEHVGIETDQGGDTWRSVYQLALLEIEEELDKIWDDSEHAEGEIKPNYLELLPKFTYAKAGAGHGGKVERNERMRADYEKGLVYHMIGTHQTLEKALYRFDNPPLDLVDADYWLYYDLIGKKKFRLKVAST